MGDITKLNATVVYVCTFRYHLTLYIVNGNNLQRISTTATSLFIPIKYINNNIRNN